MPGEGCSSGRRPGATFPCSAPILALAVDRHGEATTVVPAAAAVRRKARESLRRRERVHAYVPLDLVHGLADADRRRQVDHGVDAIERSVGRDRISHVAMDERHAVREDGLVAEVHLRLEAIDDDDIVTALDEVRDQMCADEPGASSCCWIRLLMQTVSLSPAARPLDKRLLSPDPCPTERHRFISRWHFTT